MTIIDRIAFLLNMTSALILFYWIGRLFWSISRWRFGHKLPTPYPWNFDEHYAYHKFEMTTAQVIILVESLSLLRYGIYAVFPSASIPDLVFPLVVLAAMSTFHIALWIASYRMHRRNTVVIKEVMDLFRKHQV